MSTSRSLVVLIGVTLSVAGTAAQARQGPAQEPSVQPGVNDRFLSPDLDAAAQADGFESDRREVFLRRHDVIEALGLEPGMVVADVGAGSGFYTALMAEEVGPTGRVYAVEIAPNWIEFLRDRVEEEGLSHVSVVQGTSRSVELPAGAVDLVFSSDTYHHFEFPQTTLATIHEALKPGGRWVVLDYDRIPDVTPASRMQHLRLGRAEAIEEIEQAGFSLEQLVDLDLQENYLAIFSRP